MKDTWGDKFTVEAAGAYVQTRAYEIGDKSKYNVHNFNAAQARTLARKLIAAADEIDPPAIAPTHWAAEPNATDAATLAPIIAKDEPAAPYVPQVGDVVEVPAGNSHGAYAYSASRGALTYPVLATVVEIGYEGAGYVQARYADGDVLTQSVALAEVSLVSPADAPDVDPAEPRGGCCGGGSRYDYLDGDYPC